jgi:hypothetical protein
MNTMHSRILFLSLLGILISSCQPPAKKTPLPGTSLQVSLIGPDGKNHYHYAIIEKGEVVASRFLGPAQVRSEVPTIIDEGSGRMSVSWGGAGNGAFIRIDTINRLILEDSNRANPSNRKF